MGPKSRRGVPLALQDVLDRGQREPQFPQQQDALEPDQGLLVVIAVAVGALAARLEETDVSVVPQGPARGAGPPGDFLYGLCLQ